MRLATILPLAAFLFTASIAAPGYADRVDSPNARPAIDAPRAFPIRPPSADRALIRQMVLKRRRLQIKRLRQYRNRGMFPRNTYANKIRRVLVDKDGRFCAVANMIALDGQRLLVLQTAKTNRFVNFADLKSGPLVDWVNTSGITLEEIAAIQLPDSPILEGRVGIVRPPVDPVIVQVNRERVRLTKHLLTVERLLVKQTLTSVDAITDRIMKNPQLMAQLLQSARYTNVQPI